MRRQRTLWSWAPIAALAAVGCAAAACGPIAPDPTSSRPLPQTAPTTAATTTTSTTTSTTVPASSNTVSYTWARAAGLPAGLAGGGGNTATLADVLAPQSGGDWVLAGTRTSAAGATSATVWTSRNAANWKATRLQGGPGSQARAAVYWGSRTVVVGSVGDGPSQRAAIWISHDPTAAFKAVPDDPALDAPAGGTDVSAGTAWPSGDSATPAVTSGPGATMDNVAAGALGLFASGTVAGHLAMWYSTNGTTWVRLPGAERVIESAPGAVVRQILETPAGVFAVGSVRRGNSTTGALWESGDGIHWHVGSGGGNFGAGGDATLTSIATLGPNLVLGGGVRLGSPWVPASWISPNSQTWGAPSQSFPEPTGPRQDIGGTVLTDISAAPDADVMAAVGGSPTEQRLWTSTDGINWSSSALPKAAADDADWTAGAVATTGATTVVVDTDAYQPRLLVRGLGGGPQWQEISAPFGAPRPVVTPTHLVTDAGRLVMTVDVDSPGRGFGDDRDSTEILTSADGRHWKVEETGGTFENQTVTDLAVTGRGLVAVGGPSATTAAVTGPGPATTTVWTSNDGASWKTLQLGPTGVTSPPTTAPAATTTTPAATTTSGPTTAPVATTTAPAATTTAPAATGASSTTVPVSGSNASRIPTASAPSSYEVPTGAATSLGKTVFVAGSSPTDGVLGWKSPDRSTWNPLGALHGSATSVTGGATTDPEPATASQTDSVAGGCSTSGTAVLVGSAGTGEGGSNAMTWTMTGAGGSKTVVTTAQSGAPPASSASSAGSAGSSKSGKASTATPGIAPAPPADSAERLLGCTVTVENTFVAWGGSATGSGTPEAALWTSDDGTTWTRQSVPAWTTPHGTAALTDLASNGTTWLAVGGSSNEPWTADTLSGLAIWESGNDGKTWQELDTTAPAWDATIGVSANLVTFLGATPVVVGQTDGHLAVWTGTATL